MDENIKITRRRDNLTVLTEKMPDVRSATIGIWLRTGSRHEPENLNGIHHFIEHAVFKGTNRRTAFDIAVESDRLGGHLDAFTSHELTGFTLKVTDESVAQGFDLLADMIANPLFEEKELRREQRVIIEEMKMVEDAPEEFLGEIFNRAVFPEHALGLPIEGTRKTVKTFNHATTAAFHRENFAPAQIVVAAAGNVEHAQIVELTADLFGDSKDQRPKTKDQRPFFTPQILLKHKPNLEQVNLILAAPYTEAASEKRYAATLLANILGGGTSSRLWQAVRERRGLAYSVGASALSFADAGVFSIYAGTSPGNFETVVDLSVAEMRKIRRDGVTMEELELVKAQAVAAILFALESTSSRASILAEQEIVHGKQISLDETLTKIAAVTPDDVREIALEYFRTENLALVALGNLKNVKIDHAHLAVS